MKRETPRAGWVLLCAAELFYRIAAYTRNCDMQACCLVSCLHCMHLDTRHSQIEAAPLFLISSGVCACPRSRGDVQGSFSRPSSELWFLRLHLCCARSQVPGSFGCRFPADEQQLSFGELLDKRRHGTARLSFSTCSGHIGVLCSPSAGSGLKCQDVH